MNEMAVILVYTGSPDAPTADAVRPFLAEFLSDPHVVDLPVWFWKPVLNQIILKSRPAKSAKKYAKIWLPEGSPLHVYTRSLAAKLENLLNQQSQSNIQVFPAAQYGSPNLKDVLAQVKRAGVEKTIILPLYPQYASVTTASIESLVKQHAPNALFIRDYHDHPAYIHAISAQISAALQKERPQKLLFSYHSIPVKRIQAGDPYQKQCLSSTENIIKQLNFPQEDTAIGFQSRFGKGKWLTPNSQEILASWAKSGIKSVQVITPGFAADCLETLCDIKIEYTAFFKAMGGKALNYIPALNDSELHVQALAEILKTKLF